MKARGKPKADFPEALWPAWELGFDHAWSHLIAVDRYNQRPPSQCPYDEGTPEITAYDGGWYTRCDAWVWR